MDDDVVPAAEHHGAVTAPLYLVDKKIPGGIFNPAAIKNRLQGHLLEVFGVDSLVVHMENFQVYMWIHFLSLKL